MIFGEYTMKRLKREGKYGQYNKNVKIISKAEADIRDLLLKLAEAHVSKMKAHEDNRKIHESVFKRKKPKDIDDAGVSMGLFY